VCPLTSCILVKVWHCLLPASCRLLSWLIFGLEYGGDISLRIVGLHGTISQKIDVFIVIAVTASNATLIYCRCLEASLLPLYQMVY
jgi:hypothetical protein